MMNIEQLNDWQYDVRSGLKREIESLREREELLCNYMKLLDATSEVIDDMGSQSNELQRSREEVDSLQAEIDTLRQQLIEAKEQALAAQEADAKPTEIHNHFEQGCSAQVFNDKVNGKFTRKQNDKKANKKRWKKIARKML